MATYFTSRTSITPNSTTKLVEAMPAERLVRLAGYGNMPAGSVRIGFNQADAASEGFDLSGAVTIELPAREELWLHLTSAASEGFDAQVLVTSR